MALDGQRGLAYNIAMALVARVTRYSIFVHHHSFAYIDQDSRLMQMLVRVIGARATHIVLCDCMTNGLRARYPEMARATAIELSSAAFVDVTARDDLRPADDIQIGFLSNLIIEKGLDTSIEFLRAARRENLPVKLLLAGRAPDERATTMVKEALLEFGDAINYLGPIPESEKQDFYHGIDAFIFPTRYINEAQPRAILESLAFGVPVLTIARSCITGDVGEGSGICVPPDGDFTAHALPLVREWCADRESLRRSSREAKQRSDVIYQLGQRQLAAVVDAFYPSAKAWRAVSSGRIAR
jgi:glycosyltransferase involved in cell wall biosynthesis